MKFTLEIADRKGQVIAKVQAHSFDVLEAILGALKEKGLVDNE